MLTMVVMTLVWTADLAIDASRIFRVERRGPDAESSLAMLPLPLARIARQKALGCLLASWPAVPFFLGGFALTAPEIWRDMFWTRPVPLRARRNFSRTITEWFPTIAIPAACIAFFVHLVAWLSLRMKFGALPLAVVIFFVGTQMVGMFFAFTFMAHLNGNVTVYLMLAMALIGAAILHATIPRRLEQLASED